MADFEVVVLGVGDTFSERHHSSALLLRCEGFSLAIDCPDMYRGVLKDASKKTGITLSLSDIRHVLITHVHGDHMNGLEGNFGPAHTPYASLAALPAELRAKMRLIHYADAFDTDASVITPLGEGEILRP